MRPQSIKLFDLFYLGSLFLGVLGFISGYAGAEALLARQSAEQGVAVPPVVLIIGYSIGMLIHLALWYFVSRKRSTVAKWIIVALFLFSLIGVGGYFQGPMPLNEIYGLLSLIANAVAVGLLFRGDTIRWLEGGRGDETPAD
tara:strand:+ start:339 stop:764 length:426 start_codon:yes stop_codon:yes gene_type:complete